MSFAGSAKARSEPICKISPIKTLSQAAESYEVHTGDAAGMSEKPYQKPEDGVVLAFKEPLAQLEPGSTASRWAGTDLARFAQDVVALNSRSQETQTTPRCQVAPLESMQRGLRIKKKTTEEPDSQAAEPVNLSRFRKE
jgi:hypothetical protein